MAHIADNLAAEAGPSDPPAEGGAYARAAALKGEGAPGDEAGAALEGSEQEHAVKPKGKGLALFRKASAKVIQDSHPSATRHLWEAVEESKSAAKEEPHYKAAFGYQNPEWR